MICQDCKHNGCTDPLMGESWNQMFGNIFNTFQVPECEFNIKPIENKYCNLYLKNEKKS